MKTKILALLLIIGILYTSVPCVFAAEKVSMKADYTESTAAINNPERGFYVPLCVYAKVKANTAVSSSAKLVHLRVGIGCFSDNYMAAKQASAEASGNTDKLNECEEWKAVYGRTDYISNGSVPISDDFLAALGLTLNNIRKNGGSVIIRFAYDNFYGNANYEPSISGIVDHIKQLSGIFRENADVIAAVESGFFGPWGEQHTSNITKSSEKQTNFKQLVDTLLLCVPAPITVSVRRPLYYSYVTGIDISKLNFDKPQSNSPYYRVGVFNDGYLGSSSDLGTYVNREKETEWLNYQAGHTLFGGECVFDYSDSDTSSPLGPYNSPAYIAKEMFVTHTSYLNKQWNNFVIDAWKNTVYNGDDSLYKGLSAFRYIENHLGYRFVLTNSFYIQKSRSVCFEIKNVGAGNVVKPKEVTLMLKNDNAISEVETNIDVCSWSSLKTVSCTTVLPQSVIEGDYLVYIKISDANGNQIQFANNNEFCENGNYIGCIEVNAVSEVETENDNESFFDKLFAFFNRILLFLRSLFE